ncbi:glycosyltransferase group 1 family protein [Acinetobacter sp. CAG:196]|nr:glycosyltransferase group 1 family protein [Acinetobacter sp. CAG:196]
MNIILLLKKIIYLFEFLPKMPDDKLSLKLFRNHMRKVIFNKNNLYFLDKCTNNSKINIQNNDKLNIMVVTHDFSNTGAPKVTLDLCKKLKEIYDANIYIVGPSYGDLKEEFDKYGNVFYISDLPVKKENFAELCNKFNLILVSSLSNEMMLSLYFCKSLIKTPVIWYTHEIHKKDFMLTRVGISISDLILCVSSLVEKSIKNIDKKAKTQLLMYGLDDIKMPTYSCNKEKVIFLCIGTLSKRKNQKLFAEAIKMIPEKLREKCKFYIIGSPIEKEDFVYEAELKTMTSSIKEVEYIPNIPQKKLFEYYNMSDCIVCTSVQDPLPIVVTHGFMFNKIPVISSVIGQALLCENNKNAIIFDNQKPDDLSKILSDIAENKEKYTAIAANSRDIYDKYFSMENFKESIKNILDKYLR